MNVKQRINARKVVLSYIYQYCFFDKLQDQDLVAVESLFIGNIFKTDNERFDTAKKDYIKNIKTYLKGPETEEDLMEFVDLFFDEWNKEDIDFDYLAKVGLTFVKYIPEITDRVNSLTESFKFDQMDTIDQALFIL